MQLITYADRLAGDLQGLRRILDIEFAGLFSGVHVLPFFDPIDGADTGFDPVDHCKVDPRLGTWQDIEALSRDYAVMADLIVNHISADSSQFRDVRKHGRASSHWDLFLRRSDVFPAGPHDRLAEEVRRIYRPRPGLPFTAIALDDGTSYDFWTTFSEKQLDINVETSAGRAYLDSILSQFATVGVREIRLDAAGYAIKRRGTSCFMLPETFDFIAALSEQAGSLGMSALVEIHSHFQMQITIAESVQRVYDFALPPLVLHTLYTGDSRALKRWLAKAPRNCVTVLDTHDGIGILDVARQGELDGLLDDDAIDNLVETIHDKTGGESRDASGHAASNLDIYQVNSTYYSALGGDDRDYLIARAIQFFAPGMPQVYYTGLLAGENDAGLVQRTGVGRDINRHFYSSEEIAGVLQRPVVRALAELIRLRNASTAFDGVFTVGGDPPDRLSMRWENEDALAELQVEFGRRRARLTVGTVADRRSFVIDENLLNQIRTGANPGADA